MAHFKDNTTRGVVLTRFIHISEACRRSFAQNDQGQSLIQVLISVGIMGILSLTMISMFTYHSNENRALGEKLAALDLERTLTQALTSSCNALLQPSNLVTPGSLTISDASSLSASNPFIIKLKDVTTQSGRKIASVGQPASAMSNTLVTSEIQIELTNINSAHLVIKFDRSKLVRALMDLKTPLLLTTDWPAVPTAITGCGSVSPGIRVDGASDVSGSTCTGVNVGGFCDNMFRKVILFSQPFSVPPKVMVSGRADSIFTFCPCCNGASDQNIAYAKNITETGFEAFTSISPTGSACGLPYVNWSTQMAFDWIAIGN